MSHLRTKSTADRPLFCVWEVKRMKRDDELFARYSTATWWTNLPEDADTVIQLYHVPDAILPLKANPLPPDRQPGRGGMPTKARNMADRRFFFDL